MSKYIIVLGGVVSGVGKGVVAASSCLLLKSRGHSVEYMKFDPYANIDAGLLGPNEHGETFVLNSGKEVDLDCGHMERISNLSLNDDNVCTYGQLFKELIEEQERGDYLGKTITNNPFMTDKIIKRLENLSNRAEIVIAEIGGTIDDMESSVFLNAICQLKQKYRNNCIIVLVSPVLWLDTIKEFKTKPLQRSVRDVQSFGIIPDLLICRSIKEIPNKILDKISMSTNIPRDSIIVGIDCATIYEVPIKLYEQNFDDILVDKFSLKRNACRISKYKEVVERYINNDASVINIGIFGKYDNCDEAYISLKESLVHAGIANDVKVSIAWVKTEELEKYKDNRGLFKHFEGLHGIIVPGGFSNRGIEGKIKAIQYVREKKMPFLGICLGLQCAVIEFARNMCGFEHANSLEFDEATPYPVVHYIPGQEKLKKKSATMRLGAYDCNLTKDSLASEIYGSKVVSERHRHRYEINKEYIEQYAPKGLLVSGVNQDTGLIEIMELDKNLHPYFIGTQAHPEYNSKLTIPAPLFKSLISAALKYRNILQTTVE